jgi:hypothetical protein
MTPREKANELIEKYADCLPSIFYNVVESKNYHSAKRCALIGIDEILNETADENGEFELFFILVKQEIEKL